MGHIFLLASSRLGPPSGALGVAVGHVFRVDVLLFPYFAVVRVGLDGRASHLEHDPRLARSPQEMGDIPRGFWGWGGAAAMSGACQFLMLLAPVRRALVWLVSAREKCRRASSNVLLDGHESKQCGPSATGDEQIHDIDDLKLPFSTRGTALHMGVRYTTYRSTSGCPFLC